MTRSHTLMICGASIVSIGAFASTAGAQASFTSQSRSLTIKTYPNGALITSVVNAANFDPFSVELPSTGRRADGTFLYPTATATHTSTLSPARMSVSASGTPSTVHLGPGYWPLLDASSSFEVRFHLDSPTPFRLRANGGDYTTYYDVDVTRSWVRLSRGSTVLFASEASRPAFVPYIPCINHSALLDATGSLAAGDYTFSGYFLATGRGGTSPIPTLFSNGFSATLELPAPGSLMVPAIAALAGGSRRRRR